MDRALQELFYWFYLLTGVVLLVLSACLVSFGFLRGSMEISSAFRRGLGLLLGFDVLVQRGSEGSTRGHTI